MSHSFWRCSKQLTSLVLEDIYDDCFFHQEVLEFSIWKAKEFPPPAPELLTDAQLEAAKENYRLCSTREPSSTLPKEDDCVAFSTVGPTKSLPSARCCRLGSASTAGTVSMLAVAAVLRPCLAHASR